MEVLFQRAISVLGSSALVFGLNILFLLLTNEQPLVFLQMRKYQKAL